MTTCRILFALILLLLSVGELQAGEKPFVGETLRIARQHSIMYAPVYVMERLGLMEKYLPGMEIQWLEMGSGAVMNEALAADRMDVAFMGTPPAIIAWNVGLEIRILSNLCISPLGLQVRDANIARLADFGPNDKIAMPGLGSIQHILLAMACERELGNAHALDNNLIAMTHPDGAMAMLSGGGPTAHLTALPYIAKENEAGFPTILTGTDAFGGDYSTIVSVATKKIHDRNPLALAATLAALNEAMWRINSRDSEVMAIIADKEKISVSEVEKFLDWEGTNYTTTLYGLEGMMAFMEREKYITRRPALRDLLWETACSTIGQRSGRPGVLEKAQAESMK